MRSRAEPITHAHGGLHGAVRRGEYASHDWIRDGVVLSAVEFAERRGLTAQALGAMVAAGEAFCLNIDGEPWWPAVLLELESACAGEVCRVLVGCESVTKLIFFMRQHGALGGRTVAQALALGDNGKVLQLAREWGTAEAQQPL